MVVVVVVVAMVVVVVVVMAVVRVVVVVVVVVVLVLVIPIPWPRRIPCFVTDGVDINDDDVASTGSAVFSFSHFNDRDNAVDDDTASSLVWQSFSLDY